MKTIMKYTSVALLAFAFTSCVNQLNTSPIDKNSTTAFNQSAVFSKCYATLALTGQKGPSGDCDIDDLDEGTSSLYRMMWELNEFCTDEGWWIWNDVGLADIRIMNWNGDNALVKGLYYRLNIDIKLCNHFLANTENAKDQKTIDERNEVRFIRALNYWYMLDMFKVAPLSLTESDQLPTFVERYELYKWLVGELQDLSTVLPEQRKSLYRIDRYAAELLLARTYLNAEVYNKGNKDWVAGSVWSLAKTEADQVINSHYKMLETPTTIKEGYTFSAYQKLFMADNHRNGAQNETLLMIYQDGLYCQSWGGSRFLVNVFRDQGMLPSGSADTWKCFRTSPEFVAKFVDLTQAINIAENEYKMPSVVGDDRAIMRSDSSAYKIVGSGSSEFYDCWSVLKFTGVRSDCDSLKNSVGSDANFPDTDIPLMRVSEAYMIKAEALYRQGDASGALNIINNVIRKRANATPLTKLDDAILCDEWAREFYCEGRRRTDLIRFDRFAGPQADAAAYHWEGRADLPSTAQYKSVEEKWNWFPIPNDDKATNKNYGNTSGDGYTDATK